MVTVSFNINQNSYDRLVAALRQAYPNQTPKNAIMNLLKQTVLNIEASNIQKQLNNDYENQINNLNFEY